MKPKDLKRFFTFEERRPFLEDHIFYVPVYYTEHEKFALPHFHQYFGNPSLVSVEYCSGNGDWILEKAAMHPERNWVAVEKRFDRVRKIWSKLKNQGIKNLLIVHAEALTFTRHYLPSESVDEVYINFPDPWPKFKHAKNRLLQHPFLNELSRVLPTGKKVVFVTDALPYLEETIKYFQAHPHFTPFFPDPFYQVDLPYYGSSWFENLWKEKGKPILFTQFIKR